MVGEPAAHAPARSSEDLDRSVSKTLTGTDDQALGADALWLAELDVLAVPLVACHPYHAARAELLRRLGRVDEAEAANRTALSLTSDQAKQRLLHERFDREQDHA